MISKRKAVILSSSQSSSTNGCTLKTFFLSLMGVVALVIVSSTVSMTEFAKLSRRKIRTEPRPCTSDVGHGTCKLVSATQVTSNVTTSPGGNRGGSTVKPLHLNKLVATLSPTVATRSSTLHYQTWAVGNAQCMKTLARPPTNRIGCCLQQLRHSLPLGMTQQDLPALKRAKFTSQFIEALPPTDLPSFGSCAVVSSASSLKKYRFGKEIDSHDAVFRINVAPTAGFEHMVGSRTTVRLINSKVQKHIVNDKKGILSSLLNNVTVFIRDAVSSHTFLQSNPALVWDKVFTHPLSNYVALKKMGYSTAFLNHPIFSIFTSSEILKSCGFRISSPASSGFQSVILAILLCDSVTAYEIATDDKMSMVEKYYFKPEGKSKSIPYGNFHPLKFERMILPMLGRKRLNSSVYDIRLRNTCT